MSGQCSVTALAEPFEMSLPAVSKHLRVLERAGLIARGREAQWRPCRIEPGPLKDIADWAERYRHVWEARLDRLDDYLQELKAGKAAPRAGERDTTRRKKRTSGRNTHHKEQRHGRQQRRK